MLHHPGIDVRGVHQQPISSHEASKQGLTWDACGAAAELEDRLEVAASEVIEMREAINQMGHRMSERDKAVAAELQVGTVGLALTSLLYDCHHIYGTPQQALTDVACGLASQLHPTACWP
jgi:hypothetical protein